MTFRAYLALFSKSDMGQMTDRQTNVMTFTEGSYTYHVQA